jgi:phosphotransacetylase
MDDSDKQQRTKQKDMSELPTVLLPEAEDPVVAALRDEMAQAGPEREQELGAHLRFEEEMPIGDAAQMLDRGEVDILIAGQKNGSPEVLAEAIGITKRRIPEDRKGERPRMSSFFIMEKDGEEPIFLTDCAVNIEPSTQQLVNIAEQTCESVQQLGHEPVVAFLSYSTFGSAKGRKATDVREATEAFKEKHPDIPTYGEIQLDAAVDPEVFKKKAAKAGIELAGDKMPNVFVLPNGEAGNLFYKAMERFGGYRAVGPMLTGTLENMHDLSRGGTKEALVRSIEVAAQLYKARQAAAQAHEGTETPQIPTE